MKTNVADTSGQSTATSGKAEHDSWRNWMGNNHDGVSLESDWSTDWPDDGLPEKWRREIGIGFSSISIDGGRLFTMGHRDGKETLFCLDRDSGETIWSHTYESSLVDNLYEGGPGSTPTLDEGRVYSVGKEGQLFCIRIRDGEVIWERDLQDDLDVGLPEWGFNGSPFIHGKQLILEAGRVVSYDKLTGELLWKTDKHTAGYGTASRFQPQGRDLIATLDSDAVRIVEASNGREIDAFPWKSPFRTNSTTPIAQGDTLFVSTGYQVGCGLFRLINDRLELEYDNKSMRNHFNNSILHDGHLYGFDGNSNFGRVVHLVCMNHETGDVEWKKSGLGCGSLMIADGKLVILSDDGRLVIADATPEEFRERCQAQILSGRCWTVPVLLNGCVYARNAAGDLVCVQLPKKRRDESDD